MLLLGPYLSVYRPFTALTVNTLIMNLYIYIYT